MVLLRRGLSVFVLFQFDLLFSCSGFFVFCSTRFVFIEMLLFRFCCLDLFCFCCCCLFRYLFCFDLFASVVLVFSTVISVSICFTSVFVVLSSAVFSATSSSCLFRRFCSVVYSHVHTGTHVFPVVNGVGGAAGLLLSDGGFDSMVMVMVRGW